ncbi:MAG: hypothetical protein ACRDRN_10765 [Sciscionella sp.]
MSRRASLPGAAELFRSTATPRLPDPALVEPESSAQLPVDGAKPPTADGVRRSSGRQKHNAKITVYVSDDELVALEHARIGLRAGYGLVADRGRIVREAIAALLADHEEHGEDSLLVRRLRKEPDR